LLECETNIIHTLFYRLILILNLIAFSNQQIVPVLFIWGKLRNLSGFELKGIEKSMKKIRDMKKKRLEIKCINLIEHFNGYEFEST